MRRFLRDLDGKSTVSANDIVFQTQFQPQCPTSNLRRCRRLQQWRQHIPQMRLFRSRQRFTPMPLRKAAPCCLPGRNPPCLKRQRSRIRPLGASKLSSCLRHQICNRLWKTSQGELANEIFALWSSFFHWYLHLRLEFNQPNSFFHSLYFVCFCNVSYGFVNPLQELTCYSLGKVAIRLKLHTFKNDFYVFYVHTGNNDFVQVHCEIGPRQPW